MGRAEMPLEAIVKGFANHRRIEIMRLLQRRTSGLTLEAVASACSINMKTASEHLRRLHRADLIEKHKRGRAVEHVLTRQGRNILTFLRKLE